jgi:hypothetical protein
MLKNVGSEMVKDLSNFSQGQWFTRCDHFHAPRFHLQMAALLSTTEQNLSIGLLYLILLVFFSRRVYSVYFGPLAKFPGPKLAAATLWYEFYYDVILQGRYTFKIKELHEKYGIHPPFSFL